MGLYLTCLAIPVVQCTTEAWGMNTQSTWTSHRIRSGSQLQRPCQSLLSSMYAGRWTSCAYLQVHEHAYGLDINGQFKTLHDSRMESKLLYQPARISLPQHCIQLRVLRLMFLRIRCVLGQCEVNEYRTPCRTLYQDVVRLDTILYDAMLVDVCQASPQVVSKASVGRAASIPAVPLHHKIWKLYQTARKLHAELPHNLILP